MTILKSRVGEMWEGTYNGFPTLGMITSSQAVGYRYDYYPELNKREIWQHFVKIIRSNNLNYIGKTHKWKEDSICPFEKFLKRIYPIIEWQVETIK